jgi:hypothetical protein
MEHYIHNTPFNLQISIQHSIHCYLYNIKRDMLK